MRLIERAKAAVSGISGNSMKSEEGEAIGSEVRIEAPAPDAVTCRIHFGRAVSPAGTSLFETPDEAAAWPVVRALLGIPGMHSVIGKGDILVVARHASTDWAEIFGVLESRLRAVLENLAPIEIPGPPASVTSAPLRPAPSPDSPAEAALRHRVSVVIVEKINPALDAHGGYIDLIDVRDTQLLIHMGGGCQGCAMSAATLRNGVETILRAELPEITEILDTTDHHSGTNPFFRA
jgi:Fe-S cluster biogenesis protein NfuA